MLEKTMTVEQILDKLPDGQIRSAVLGIPRNFKIVIRPEKLHPINLDVILIGRPGEEYLPAKYALLTDADNAAELEKEYDLKRIYTYMPGHPRVDDGD